MKNPAGLFAFLAFLFLYIPSIKAQDSPVSSTGPSTSTADGSVTNSNSGNSEEADKPFAPHWTGQVGTTYSNQPSQGGQGQIQKELGLTGTYNFTEGGHYLSLGLVGGQQIVEGADTNYGKATLSGGLGLGSFLPSLDLEMQRGASALNSSTASLTLNFKLFDSLEIGPLVSAGLESHQGPVSTTGLPGDRIVEIDSGNFSGGFVVTFIPWDFLTLTLTSQQEYDDTYQIQNVTHTTQIPLNQRDRIPSVTLGENITFLKDFELDLSQQYGQEFYPAGTVYSPVLGKTVTFANPTTQNFAGFLAGLMYNFQ